MHRKSNLKQQTDFYNPFETEKYVLSLNNANKYKSTVFTAYQHYCLTKKITWVLPRIKCRSAPIIVPTELRISKVFGRCSLKYITTFQISKHELRPDDVSKIV